MDPINDAGNAAQESAVSETSVVETSSDAGSGTARDSIDRAFAAVDAQESGSPEAAATTDTRKRDEGGRFAAGDPSAEKAPAVTQDTAQAVETKAEASPLDEPPSRFTPDAKAAWKDAPASIKGEVTRAFRELESGIASYKEKQAPLEPFMQMAAKSGTTLDAALGRYVTMEQALRKDPVAGLEDVCRNMGISLRDIAAHVMGQPVDQQQAQASHLLHQANERIAQLEQRVNGVPQQVQEAFEQRQRQALMDESINAFAAQQPRFEELAPVMAQLIESGIAPRDMQTAYSMAERLNPVSTPVQVTATTAATAAPATNLAAQTRKGSLSVTGAPSSGSNPTNRKPSSSAREALDRSFAQTGVTG